MAIKNSWREQNQGDKIFEKSERGVTTKFNFAL